MNVEGLHRKMHADHMRPTRQGIRDRDPIAAEPRKNSISAEPQNEPLAESAPSSDPPSTSDLINETETLAEARRSTRKRTPTDRLNL